MTATDLDRMRLPLAAMAGLTGLSSIIIVLLPTLISHQQVWLIGTIVVLLILTVLGTVGNSLAVTQSDAAQLPAATSADKVIHGEVVKIVAAMSSQLDANASYSASLAKARDAMPEDLDPGKIKLVVNYLIGENEKMREKTTDLQKTLETSQRQIEKLKSNLAEAQEKVLVDPMTNLKNRRGFDLALATEASNARSTSKPLSLIIADIDHFKSVNDNYGHQTGDEVIKWVASQLAVNVKGRDTVSRYGGEEFAILLPQTTLQSATTLAEQIRAHLQNHLWKKSGSSNTMLRITASFGIAQLAEGESTTGLIQRADAKLYESKSKGRNRVTA